MRKTKVPDWKLKLGSLMGLIATACAFTITVAMIVISIMQFKKINIGESILTPEMKQKIKDAGISDNTFQWIIIAVLIITALFFMINFFFSCRILTSKAKSGTLTGIWFLFVGSAALAANIYNLKSFSLESISTNAIITIILISLTIIAGFFMIIGKYHKKAKGND